MLVAGWCVIKSSPVALYFPYCSSLSHLAYSGPQFLECYKSLVLLSFLMLLKRKKWTFNPLDSTFYYYSCRLNLRPKNSSKIGKHIDREEEKKSQMLIPPPHPHFPAAFPWLENVSDVEGNLPSLKVAVFHVQKIYCITDVFFISLALWSWDSF